MGMGEHNRDAGELRRGLALVAAVVAIPVACLQIGAWGVPPWSGILSGYQMRQQVYSGLVERAYACGVSTSGIPAPGLLSGRGDLIAYKIAASNIIAAGQWALASAADSNGDYSAWFAASTNYDYPPRLWTATRDTTNYSGLVTSNASFVTVAGLRTNWASVTPLMALSSDTNYGWPTMTNLLTLMRFTYREDHSEYTNIPNLGGDAYYGGDVYVFLPNSRAMSTGDVIASVSGLEDMLMTNLTGVSGFPMAARFVQHMHYYFEVGAVGDDLFSTNPPDCDMAKALAEAGLATAVSNADPSGISWGFCDATNTTPRGLDDCLTNEFSSNTTVQAYQYLERPSGYEGRIQMAATAWQYTNVWTNAESARAVYLLGAIPEFNFFPPVTNTVYDFEGVPGIATLSTSAMSRAYSVTASNGYFAVTNFCAMTNAAPWQGQSTDCAGEQYGWTISRSLLILDWAATTNGFRYR